MSWKANFSVFIVITVTVDNSHIDLERFPAQDELGTYRTDLVSPQQH